MNKQTLHLIVLIWHFEEALKGWNIPFWTIHKIGYFLPGKTCPQIFGPAHFDLSHNLCFYENTLAFLS